MNDSAFLTEFYGPTLLWFGPIMVVIGLLTVISNALLLWIALSTPSIRSVNSNWFVVCMGISDFLFGLNISLLSGIAFFCGRDGSCPSLVAVCGALSLSTVASSFVFPAFIAMNRYLKVTKLPSDSSRIRKFMISSKAILMLTFCASMYVIGVSLILATFDGLGEDLFGYYCAKRFTSFWLYLVYMTGASFAMSSYLTSFYFYGKLQKFVLASIEQVGTALSSRTQQQRQENSETKAVMKMVKLSTLVPMIAQSGTFILDGGQWFLPVDLIPMWLKRFLAILFFLPPLIGPWISMLVLRPFKREFKRRFENVFRLSSVGAVNELAQ